MYNTEVDVSVSTCYPHFSFLASPQCSNPTTHVVKLSLSIFFMMCCPLLVKSLLPDIHRAGWSRRRRAGTKILKKRCTWLYVETTDDPLGAPSSNTPACIFCAKCAAEKGQEMHMGRGKGQEESSPDNRAENKRVSRVSMFSRQIIARKQPSTTQKERRLNYRRSKILEVCVCV